DNTGTHQARVLPCPPCRRAFRWAVSGRSEGSTLKDCFCDVASIRWARPVGPARTDFLPAKNCPVTHHGYPAAADSSRSRRRGGDVSPPRALSGPVILVVDIIRSRQRNAARTSKESPLKHIGVFMNASSLRHLAPMAVAALLSVAPALSPAPASATPTAGVSAVVLSKQTVDG